jgi:hypothetical protein
MNATLLSSAPARGGKRLVFTQTDAGVVYGPFVEHRPVAEDAATFMAAHGEALAASLDARELADNVDRVTAADFDESAAPIFARTTRAQLAARVRDLLLLGSVTGAIRVCLWLEKQTDNELRTWFGLTVGQVNGLRTQLTNLRAGVDAARTALGNIRSAL